MTSIFIVEDDKSILLLYKKFLDFNGFHILGTAENGEEAIIKYREFDIKPDIVLMDHRMPIKNGIEASKEILSIDSKSQIIFASADKTIEEEVTALGIARFLEKPFNLEELITNIEFLSNMN